MKFFFSFLVAISFLLSSGAAIAQAKLTDAETQDFFKLIKQTNEYKALKNEIDSVNKANKTEVMELKIEIVKQHEGDFNIFTAQIMRRFAGLQLQTHYFSYDRIKKQLVAGH